MKKTAFLFILILSFVTHDILAQCVSVGSDFTICKGASIPDLGGILLNPATAVIWDDNGAGGSFSDITEPHSSWTPPAAYAGTATLTLSATDGSCLDTHTSASLNVIVDAPVTPSVTIAADPSGPVCQGTNVIFTPTAINGGTPAYQWKVNGLDVGTGSTYSSSGLNNGDAVAVTMTSSLSCVTGSTDNSNIITMDLTTQVTPSVTIAANPSGPVCPGTNIIFTPTAVHGGTPSYQWKVNGLDVGTGPTYSSSLLNNGDAVTVTMTSSLSCVTGNTDISNTITIALTTPVTPSVTIAASPSSTICSGSSVTFTATPVNEGSAATYQWRVNGTNVGSGGTTYTTSTLANGNVVTVVMTSSVGCTSANPVTSAGITMTVNPIIPVSVSISATPSGAICAGNSVTFNATPTNGGTPTYQWKINGSNVGTNSSAFTSSTLSNNDIVTVQMTSNLTCPSVSTATSNSVQMVVNALPVPGLISSDADHIICAGTSVTFTASGGATYTFYAGGAMVQTGSSSTYTTTTLANGQDVYVVVGNAALCTATSSSIHFTVNPLPTITISSGPTCAANLATYSLTVTVSAGTVSTTAGVVAPSGTNVWTVTVPAGLNTIVSVTNTGCISSLPITAPNCACPGLNAPVSGGDKTYCAGTVIPALTASVGTGETIDWYNAASGGSSLGTGLSFTPAIPGTYYAVTRNTTTNCVSNSRTPITLTSNPLPVASIVSSDPDNIICVGTSVTFTASGGTNYNFRVAGVSAQTGVNTTFTTSALTDGQIVDVLATNANGCVDLSPGITNTVRALPTPTLVSSDADNTFCSGTSVTFTASGGTNYNFRVGGSSVQASASATYVTNTLQDHQVVDVIVTNGGCAATSAGITNSVSTIQVPELTSSDADHQFCLGTSVSFTASAGSANYNFRIGGVTVQNGVSEVFTSSTITNGQIVDVITTNVAGCSATSAGITNIVSPQPVANGGAGGSVCGLSYKFSGVPSLGLGTWTKTTGPGTVTYLPNANASNATVTVSEYGTYTFTWTEVSGQCSSSSVVTVNFYLQPVANAGSGGNNCGLGFYFSGGLNTGTGTWSKVSGPGNVTYTPNANSPNALVNVTSYGTYIFSWTVANGTCTNSQNVSIVFVQQVPASGGAGGNECDKDFTLGAVLPATGTGTWSKFSGPGSVVFTPDNHSINAKVAVDKFGTYDFAWTVINSTCSSSDVIRVVFHDLPSINAGRDTALCKGGTIQLRAQGTGTVLWSPGTKLNNRNIINPIASPDTTTTYTINLTDQYGCKNSDKIIVGVRDPILADAGPDQELGYVLNTYMDANLAHDYEKGYWSLLSGTGDLSDRANPKTSVENLSIGINEFLWTVSNGYCPISYDTANIVVNDFVIPTMITPNMDGRNDYFELRGLSTLGKTELVVFNRRGVQLFKNSDYDNLWDGVDYNNNPLPEDTYFYVLKTANGKSLSGYLVIRR